MKIEISAPVYHTESEEKVEKALKSLFPSVEFSLSKNSLKGTSADPESLTHFKLLLQMQRIRDTANTLLRKSLKRDKLTFYLNKQAAYMGKVNFSEECPLGPITVSIKGKNLETLINDLSPRTTE